MTTHEPVLMRLTGHQAAFALTPAAHDELLAYLTGARRALVDDPDGDESVRDLEVSIGEHLATLGGDAVTESQMRSTLATLGPVVSDEDERTAAPGRGERSRPWRRVLEGKWLAGVCLGISAATESNVAWVRALTVVVTLVIGVLLAPFGQYVVLTYLGLVALTYLALGLALPPVRSLAEYRAEYRRLRER